MTILNLHEEDQSNTIAVSGFLEKSCNAILHNAAKMASLLGGLILKTRKSPEDILAAQQRRADAVQRVDRLLSVTR
ncbi:MAG TPA: hypothetical protein VLA51_06325 [Paracoccaceae bacterium]|nr:hypothetical protein [Paracoccaceae bacterium]